MIDDILYNNLILYIFQQSFFFIMNKKNSVFLRTSVANLVRNCTNITSCELFLCPHSFRFSIFSGNATFCHARWHNLQRKTDAQGSSLQ